jgi:aspartate-semialdehyde dehydrogenase
MKQQLLIVLFIIGLSTQAQIIKSSSNKDCIVITDKGEILAMDDSSKLTMDLKNNTARVEWQDNYEQFIITNKNLSNTDIDMISDDGVQTVNVCINKNKLEIFIGELIYITYIEN